MSKRLKPLPFVESEWIDSIHERFFDYISNPLHAQLADVLAEIIRSNQSTYIWGNLGITISLADLPSWDNYAELRQKMYSGFTSTLLYRLLFPKRYKRLWQSFIAAQMDLQQDFLTAALEAGKETQRKHGIENER